MNWYKKTLKLADKKDYLIKKGIPKNIVDWAELLSIQINNKLTYLEWISRLAQKNIVRMKEDDSKIIETLQLFDNLKNTNKIDKKDINQFKSYGDLVKYLAPFENQNVKEEELDTEGVETVLKNKNVEVLKIETEQAASKLCKNTKWCIKNPKSFKEHGPPFFMFLLNGKPYALLHEKSGQFKDIYDNKIKEDSILPILKTSTELVKKYNMSLARELKLIYDNAETNNKKILYPNMAEGYKIDLLDYPEEYEHMPEEFKNIPGMKDIARKGWENYIYMTPGEYNNLPKEFDNLKMKNIAIKGVKYNLITNSHMEMELLPTYQDILGIDINTIILLINKVLNTTDFDEYIPERYKNIPEIRNTYIKKWVKNILSWEDENVPEDLQKEPAIQNAIIQAWKNAVLEDPNEYNIVPEQLKQYIPDSRNQEVLI
jgi:hypothetical protein